MSNYEINLKTPRGYWLGRIMATWRSFGFVDGAIAILAMMAALMVTGVGGGIAVFLALTVVGLPLTMLMYASVPTLAFALPARLFYKGARIRFGRTSATLIAVVFGLFAFNAIDVTLKAGPDGAAAQAFVSQDSGIVPIDLAPGSTLAFDIPTLNAPSVCGDLCQLALADPRIETVIMIDGLSGDGARRGIGYSLNETGATCPAPKGARQSPHYLTGFCAFYDRDVMADVVVRERSVIASNGLTAARVVTIENGAMAQRFHLAQADVAVGGGLMTPYATGALGEGPQYVARRQSQIFASFDLAVTTPHHTTTRFDVARASLVMHALGVDLR